MVGAAYVGLLGTELATRGLELHRIDQLAALVTLVSTGILTVQWRAYKTTATRYYAL